MKKAKFQSSGLSDEEFAEVARESEKIADEVEGRLKMGQVRRAPISKMKSIGINIGTLVHNATKKIFPGKM